MNEDKKLIDTADYPTTYARDHEHGIIRVKYVGPAITTKQIGMHIGRLTGFQYVLDSNSICYGGGSDIFTIIRLINCDADGVDTTGFIEVQDPDVHLRGA